MISSICVFCGSSDNVDRIYKDEAAALGMEIARRGMTLVYGGGDVGTMGSLASAAMDAGGKVVGIIPQYLNERVRHLPLTELVVVKGMHERKAMMQERADAFVALPGGIGTMEEFFEIWTWRYIGLHQKPVGLLNINGFYNVLIEFLHVMNEQGFLQTRVLDDLCIETSTTAILDVLEKAEK
jgi:uncharacterized protein (TIGR00730 family)